MAKEKIKRKKTTIEKKSQSESRGRHLVDNILIPPRVVAQIADEVAKGVANQLRRTRRKKRPSKPRLQDPIFLDTSAIIDGRIYELSKIGVFSGVFVVTEGVLEELKNIADSKDSTKRGRGRQGLELIEKIKKIKGARVVVYDDSDIKKAVDERIIKSAKKNKGRIITCDFNLAKKAQVEGINAIDIYEVANVVKTTAIPGEEFFVKVVQKGKGARQGVGYLSDGTMIVVEEGETFLEKTVKVLVSRIIQTDAGRILFSKIIRR